MVKSLKFLLFLIGTWSTARANATCKPIPGAEQLWSSPSIRWVWVGEIHGSNEGPAAIANLACLALAHTKQVTVALERPTTEQTVLEGILTAKDVSAAAKALLEEPGWRMNPDGRSSEAMLHLLMSLRELHKSYPGLEVFAIDGPFYTGAIGKRDEAMGKSVLSIATTRPNALVLVLTGNMHGLREPLVTYNTSAMVLPGEQLLSLELTNRKGSHAWTSTSDGCGDSASGVADKDAARPYGIYLDPAAAPFGKADGVFALAVSLTASPPAVGELSPLPECRKLYLEKHQPPNAPPKNGN